MQDDGSGSGQYVCLNAAPEEAPPPGGAAAGAISLLLPVFLFVSEHILGNEPELCGLFAASFVPLCAVSAAAAADHTDGSEAQVQAAIAVCLHNCFASLCACCVVMATQLVPITVLRLQACGVLVQKSKDVETDLRACGLITPDNAAWAAVSAAFAPIGAALFVQIQADSLLAVRRACLGAKTWSDAAGSADVVVVGDPLPAAASQPPLGRAWPWPSVLRGGQTALWRGVVDVVGTLAQVLNDLAQDGSEVHVSAACKTLGDAAAMYEILAVRPSQPFTAARRGLLHINSLRYLADQLTLLPLTIAAHHAAARQPVLLAATAAAAGVTAVADEQQAQFVKRLSALVKKGLQELPHLCGMDRKAGLAARKLVQRACASLRSMANALSRACAPAVQAHIFVGILGRVCSFATSKILALPDISPTDCDEIRAAFERLWTDVLPAAAAHFVQNSVVDSSSATAVGQWPAGSTPESVADLLAASCQPLRKLAAVGQLLSDRMVDIVDSWESGELPGVGLSAEQVVGVMRAVFEDNPHRKRCIERVLAVPPST